MITPVLKDLHSADLDPGCTPDDPLDFHIGFEASIGMPGDVAADLFQFTVVSAARLKNDKAVRWGRGLLVLYEFSWDEIHRMLDRVLAQSAGNNWDEITAKLTQHMSWEFENYNRGPIDPRNPKRKG